MLQFLHYMIVFVSGAVLMALEIAGSRVLAPHFGSSIFVWGSLISVVMAALSIGYYWGGWLSTREPSYGKLAVLLLVPGIVVFFLPFTLCFIIPNVMKMAPWIWDNIKVLFYWWLASAPARRSCCRARSSP